MKAYVIKNGSSKMVKKQWLSVVVALGALSASANLIGFTSAEGYVDGELGGQKGWETSAGGVVVVTADGGYVSRAGSGSRLLTLAAGLPAGSVGTEYSLTSVMDFTYDAANANTAAFYMNTFAVGSDLIRVRVRQSNTAERTFQFTLDTAGGTGNVNSSMIAEEALGLGGADTQSDRLQFNLVLKHEAGATDWLVSASVVNLDTGATLFSRTDLAFTQKAAFSEGVLNPEIAPTTGTTVDAFRIHSVEYTASSGLMGYAAWAAEQGVGGMHEDDDGDGLDNLGEYALNGDPNDPADRGMVSQGIHEVGGTNFFYFTHAMLVDTNEVEYVVETNGQGDLVLGSWTSAGIAVTSGPYDPDYWMVTNAVPIDGELQGFVRLRINEK